jgi:hypothetical protein
MKGDSGRFAVGDAVTVTGHFMWAGKDTHGISGRIVAIHENMPGEPPLYEVQPGADAVGIPFFGGELATADVT